MGGDLKAAPKGKAPTFLVAALKDPIGGNLDRIQIIKGWLDKSGKPQEKIFDVVWSDPARRKIGADGKLPPVGNTVDVARATWTNTIGTPELITVWKDPEFDPTVKAFYYARVLEIPTPRWTAYDAAYFKVKMAQGSADDHAGARLDLADLVHAGRMKRLLAEPLLHFLLLGGALFAPTGSLRGRTSRAGQDRRHAGPHREPGTPVRAHLAAPADGRGARRDWSAPTCARRCSTAKAWRSGWTATIRRSAGVSARSWSSSPKAARPTEPSEPGAAGLARFAPRAVRGRDAIQLSPGLPRSEASRDPLADAQKMLSALNRPRGGA